ncbi:MAG: hypothetical protein ABIH99_04700 [Candidatus Micrarchaeota archaeon]
MVFLLDKKKTEKKIKVVERVSSQETKSMKIPAKLLSSLSEVKKALSEISVITEVKEEKNGVKASIVESMDRQNNPYLFVSFAFGEREIAVEYSITPEVPNVDERKINVCQVLLEILSFIEGRKSYEIDRTPVYEFISSALASALEFVTVDYSNLKFKHDTLSAEHKKLVEKLAKLENEKEELNNNYFEMVKRNESLEERVKQLEKLTDEELDEEITKWIGEHDNQMDEGKFCKIYNVPRSRVQERIERMLKEGRARKI